jgi:hypothetical protein
MAETTKATKIDTPGGLDFVVRTGTELLAELKETKMGHVGRRHPSGKGPTSRRMRTKTMRGGESR